MITDKGAYVEFYLPDPDDKRKEDNIQIDSFGYAKYNYPDVPCFHVVNEGAIPVQYRAKLKQKGLVSGVSDIMFLKPSRGYHYAVLEMKRATKTLSSAVSDEQVEFLQKCRNEGGFACVCYGVKSFIAALNYYLDGIEP